MSNYSTKIEPDKVILVGVGINKTIDEKALDELAELCKTCGLLEVGRTVQNRHDIDVTYYIGSGKVDEIRVMVERSGATAVVFDVELNGSKARNLENALDVAVLDRSQIILDIFAQRAKSAEGKLQVELAQLEYNKPRLVGSGGRMSKLKNAIGMRGPGEKKLELDKRTIEDDILKLKKQIAELSKQRALNRKQGMGNKYKVALVGYTNSGKSTLMNTITKAGVLAEDKLFATLDPVTRKVWLGPRADEPQDSQQEASQGVEILLTDTVGFINKLPHQFINAFESTLEEARNADLILHIVDASNPDWFSQVQVVEDVLKKIGADKVKQITVYNKVDSVESGMFPNGVCISALKNIGIDELKKEIKRAL